MVNQPNSTTTNGAVSLKVPKHFLPRTWFMARGYKQADPKYTRGSIVWLHPETNDVLTSFGQKIPLFEAPRDEYKKTRAKYLQLPRERGSMYLARLKYITFVGPIKKGYTIDHIDGNTLNNNIDNLRAIPKAINSRDGGFMKKLRNNGIITAMFPKDVILAGYKRMALWKEDHTQRQYESLKGLMLRKIFFGPNYKVVDPTIAAGEEPDKYV